MAYHPTIDSPSRGAMAFIGLLLAFGGAGCDDASSLSVPDAEVPEGSAFGEGCRVSSDCADRVCVARDGAEQGVCSRHCADDTACSSGFECREVMPESGVRVCLAVVLDCAGLCAEVIRAGCFSRVNCPLTDPERPGCVIADVSCTMQDTCRGLCEAGRVEARALAAAETCAGAVDLLFAASPSIAERCGWRYTGVRGPRCGTPAAGEGVCLERAVADCAQAGGVEVPDAPCPGDLDAICCVSLPCGSAELPGRCRAHLTCRNGTVDGRCPGNPTIACCGGASP